MQGGHNQLRGHYEGTRRVSITDMQRLGIFKTGYKAIFTTNWSYRGESTGSMGFVYYKGTDFITATYTIINNYTGEGQDRKDRIYIDHVTTNYGRRAYFICPVCGELKTVLCFKDLSFKCRKCANLNYGSSQSNSRDFGERYRRKAERILKRLKYTDGWDGYLYHVTKPKRMRFETYQKLLNEFRRYQDLRDSWFGATVARRFPQFACKY